MLTIDRTVHGRPLVIGHRGAMGYAPENTFPSFERAVQLGVDMVECDVHLSADGVPVVLHDHLLDRTTSGRGPVVERTADELRRLDAGAWFGAEFAGERLPTLDELLGWCRPRVALSIELKKGRVFYDGIVERVLQLIRKHDMVERATVISFDHLAIRRIKELEPNLWAGVLYEARLIDAAAAARAALADGVMPHQGFVTSEVVRQAHEAGLGVSVWTVNDRQDARRVIDAGVDAIASNYPDLIRAELGSA